MFSSAAVIILPIDYHSWPVAIICLWPLRTTTWTLPSSWFPWLCTCTLCCCIFVRFLAFIGTVTWAKHSQILNTLKIAFNFSRWDFSWMNNSARHWLVNFITNTNIKIIHNLWKERVILLTNIPSKTWPIAIQNTINQVTRNFAVLERGKCLTKLHNWNMVSNEHTLKYIMKYEPRHSYMMSNK